MAKVWLTRQNLRLLHQADTLRLHRYVMLQISDGNPRYP